MAEGGGLGLDQIPCLYDSGIIRRFRIYLRAHLRVEEGIDESDDEYDEEVSDEEVNDEEVNGDEVEVTGTMRLFATFQNPRPSVPGRIEMTWNLRSTCFCYGYFRGGGPQSGRQYFICIPSLLYTGWVENMTDFIDDFQQRDYFRRIARRHVGTHAYVSRQGTILWIRTFIRLEPDESDPQISNPVYVVSNPANINAIYPGIDTDFNDLNTTLLHLLMGFWIRSNNDLGERVYHRFNYAPMNCRGFLELRDTVFRNQIHDVQNGYTDKCFALYVCAGARLVVVDDINDKNSTQHNRTLIQSGGVIVVEAALKYCLNLPQLVSVSAEEMQVLKIFREDAIIGRDERFVLFLGPNDSEYNSICWSLALLHDTNGVLTATLNIPQGANIEAIANWNEGIREIWARHKYEALYETSVHVVYGDFDQETLQNCAFAAPEPDMLNRILRVGNYTDRSPINDLNFNNFFIYDALRNNVRLPPEFNFDRPTSRTLYPPTNLASLPRAYPEIGMCLINSRNQKYLALYNIPNQLFKRSIEKYYCVLHREDKNKNTIGLKRGNNLYILIEKQIEWNGFRINPNDLPAYDWKRGNTPTYIQSIVESMQGRDERLGVDGYLHLKRNVQVGKRKSVLYVPLHYHPDAAKYQFKYLINP